MGIEEAKEAQICCGIYTCLKSPRTKSGWKGVNRYHSMNTRKARYENVGNVFLPSSNSYSSI